MGYFIFWHHYDNFLSSWSPCPVLQSVAIERRLLPPPLLPPLSHGRISFQGLRLSPLVVCALSMHIIVCAIFQFRSPFGLLAPPALYSKVLPLNVQCHCGREYHLPPTYEHHLKVCAALCLRTEHAHVAPCTLMCIIVYAVIEYDGLFFILVTLFWPLGYPWSLLKGVAIERLLSPWPLLPPSSHVRVPSQGLRRSLSAHWACVFGVCAMQWLNSMGYFSIK